MESVAVDVQTEFMPKFVKLLVPHLVGRMLLPDFQEHQLGSANLIAWGAFAGRNALHQTAGFSGRPCNLAKLCPKMATRQYLNNCISSLTFRAFSIILTLVQTKIAIFMKSNILYWLMSGIVVVVAS